jgi:putative flippase GtrA
MAQLTLLDVAANEEIVVPPEGFVFGRVGGDADIQLEDNSISRRQARVSNRQGTWVLEVMVVPPGQRLPRPQALQQGQQFSIGVTEFEVLAVDDDEEQPAAPTIAPSRSKPGPAPVAAPIKKSAAPARAAPPPDRTAPATPAQKRPPAKAAPPPQDDEPQDDAGGDEPAQGGVKALFVGVPKGIAYYLLNVPKLLVNPLGTVRKGIDELPSPPIAKTGLIGYALPALFVSALLPAIGTGIGALIGPGHVFILSSFLPIGPAIGSIIGALIFGFFFHPAMGWIITKLQGESDERSRSNYFLQFMTATLLLAVPQALAAILAQIRWVNLLAPFITTAASLVMTYLMYQWLVFFKVHHVVPKVIAVLGALSVVFTVIGLIGGVQRNLAWATVSTDTPSVEIPEVNTDGMTAEQKALVEKAQKDGERMQKEAAEKIAAAQGAAQDAIDDAKKAGKNARNPEKGEDPPPEKQPRKKDPEPVAAKNDPAPEPIAKNDPPPDEPSPNSGGTAGGYGTYAHLRDAVEKRLEADPTVLKNDKELQKLYGDYLGDVSEIDSKFDKERGKNRDRLKLIDHLRDAELYEKTGPALQKIAGKLHVK